MSAKEPQQNGEASPSPLPAEVAPSTYHRVAFEQALDAILVAHADGRQLDVNEAALALFGYEREELLGRSIGELLALAPAWIDEVYEHFRDHDRWQGEAVIRTSDGRQRDAALRLCPIWASPQQLIATTAIVRDVTLEKAAEADLATTHLQSRDALELVSDGFYALDPDWRFTYVNQAAERIMARPRAELLETVAWEAFPPALATPIFADLGRVRESGVSAEFDYYYPPYERWFGVRAYPTERGLAIFFRDVTANKELEQRIEAALQAAQTAHLTQNRFMAMMSHELRTPLQAMLGYADLLLSGKSGSLSRAQRQDMRAIRDGASRMAALIEQVLDLSRISAGAIELVREPVDMRQIVDQMHHDLAAQAAAKGLALEIAFPAGLPAILGDPMRVRQILNSLTTNAVKFTDRGAVRVTAEASAAEVAVAVSDTGIGIEAEELPHIFEEFRQAINGPTRRYEGAGVGLAIARRLAEQMGGRIEVSSQPGSGSTFTLFLPAVKPPARQSRKWRALPGF